MRMFKATAGGWTPGTWVNVSAATGATGQFASVDCAGVGGTLHIVAVTQDGKLFHTFHDGTKWTPVQDIGYRLRFAIDGRYRDVGVTAVGNELAMFVTTEEGGAFHVKHAMTQALGFSPNGLTDLVFGQQNFQYQVDASTAADGIHFIGVTNAGTLQHTIGVSPQPGAPLSWTSLTPITAPGPVGPAGVASVPAGRAVQLVIQSTGGALFRKALADPAFVPVALPRTTTGTPAPTAFGHLSCVQIGTDLHLCAISGGTVWVTTMNSANTFSAPMALTAITPPGTATNVAVTSRVR